MGSILLVFITQPALGNSHNVSLLAECGGAMNRRCVRGFGVVRKDDGNSFLPYTEHFRCLSDMENIPESPIHVFSSFRRGKGKVASRLSPDAGVVTGLTTILAVAETRITDAGLVFEVARYVLASV